MISIVKKGNLMPVFSMFEEFADKYLSEEMKNIPSNKATCHIPLDILEKEKEYLVLADLPGMNKEDIKINFHKSQLVIEAKSPQETITEKEKVHHRERFCGDYHRIIQLPEYVDANLISAKMQDGVLHISIPKAEEKKQNFINIQ